MKIFRSLIILAVTASLLIACSATPAEPTSVSLVGEYLNTDYTDATSLRNQLAFGTIKLEGTANAITPEQAKTFIPLWQAVIALSGDTTSAEEELTAVQDQIVAGLSTEQLQAIAAMQLTTTALNAFYAEFGLVFPTPIPGVTKVLGSGNTLSQTDRESTRTAAEALGTPVGTGSNTGQAARTLLFEKTIEYLSGVAGL